MIGSLRHLRIILAIDETRSITRAADLCHVSQPAVTLALGKMERSAGTALFLRRPQGLFPTEAGSALVARISRAFALLDPALADLAPRLKLTVTTAQLQALIAVTEAERFSDAARRLGLSQPTVHRAIGQMEAEVGRALFERTAHGTIATRPVRALAIAARLAFAELAQAQADLGDILGREVGGIVIGAMPLSRSYLLGPAIAQFRTHRQTLPIRVVEGPYPELALGLRRGEIDFLIGALRPADTVPDLVQEAFFEDGMVIVARRGHPLCLAEDTTLADLAHLPWVVPARGAPARGFFDQIFADAGLAPPASLVETGSMILMRELLRQSDHLGFISALQVAAEIDTGVLTRLPWQPRGTQRPIGIAYREGWAPTQAQAEMIAAIRAAATRNRPVAI